MVSLSKPKFHASREGGGHIHKISIFRLNKRVILELRKNDCSQVRATQKYRLAIVPLIYPLIEIVPQSLVYRISEFHLLST